MSWAAWIVEWGGGGRSSACKGIAGFNGRRRMGKWGSGRARGLGSRFIGGKEREGELGREQLGQDAKRGENADSARRSATAMAWRAGAHVAAVQRQESWFGGEYRGSQCPLGLGLGTCPPRWPAPAYGVTP